HARELTAREPTRGARLPAQQLAARRRAPSSELQRHSARRRLRHFEAINMALDIAVCGVARSPNRTGSGHRTLTNARRIVAGPTAAGRGGELTSDRRARPHERLIRPRETPLVDLNRRLEDAV